MGGLGLTNKRGAQLYGWLAEYGLSLHLLGAGDISLDSGASGSVDSITITDPDGNDVEILGGAVSFNTSLAQTAIDCAVQINTKRLGNYWAYADGDTIHLIQIVGASGTFTVVSATTTIGTTDTDVEDGADSAAVIKQGAASAMLAGSFYRATFDLTKLGISFVTDFNPIGRMDLQFDQTWYWFMNYQPVLGTQMAADTAKELPVGAINSAHLFLYNNSGSASAATYTLFGS